MKNIYLIGIMGCGKSCIAGHLSRILNKKKIDVDDYIIKTQNMNIREIFEKKGEKGFRDVESKALFEISKYYDHVVSTGGGVDAGC